MSDIPHKPAYIGLKLGGSYLYTLDEENRPIKEPDINKWGKWLSEYERSVGCDKIKECGVSTIFLGVDCSPFAHTPVLWETMIFGGEFDRETERYTSHEDAVNGHKRWVDKVRGLRIVAL